MDLVLYCDCLRAVCVVIGESGTVAVDLVLYCDGFRAVCVVIR